MLLRSAALTDIGRIRRFNEDRLLHDETLQLFGVADGVGGLPGGAEAAQCAIETVHQAVKTSHADPDLNAITLEANQAVAQLGFRLSPHFGIGSTLTYGLFRRGQVQIAHVGDSRCYLLRGGQIECLTMDHSVENEARARRARGELVWINEQHRQALTRCIGQNSPLEVDIIERTLQAGDRFLFTTDGVTKLVLEDELSKLISPNNPPDAILKNLIDLTNRRGGVDNSTAVIVIVEKTP